MIHIMKAKFRVRNTRMTDKLVYSNIIHGLLSKKEKTMHEAKCKLMLLHKCSNKLYVTASKTITHPCSEYGLDDPEMENACKMVL